MFKNSESGEILHFQLILWRQCSESHTFQPGFYIATYLDMQHWYNFQLYLKSKFETSYSDVWIYDIPWMKNKKYLIIFAVCYHRKLWREVTFSSQLSLSLFSCLVYSGTILMERSLSNGCQCCGTTRGMDHR